MRDGRVLCLVCGLGHCVMMRIAGAWCGGVECGCEGWSGGLLVGGVFFEVFCMLRFFERFEMVMCMGGGPGVDRCLFWWVVLAFVMLEAMSGCLVCNVSCSGVGPEGSLLRKLCSMVCHLGEMGVDCGSCLFSVLVRERRCSGEYALS